MNTKVLLNFKGELPCIKNNFTQEKNFLLNWKKAFNPHLLNQYFLQIIYLEKQHSYLNLLATLSKKDNLHLLTFPNSKIASSCFNDISTLNLNWKKRLAGNIIEIEWIGHSTETLNDVNALVKKFLYLQKLSAQAKRNSLLKKGISKKVLDEEIKQVFNIFN